MIFNQPIDGLQSLIADGENAVAYDVAFLLSENRRDARRPDARDCLDSIIATRNSGGNKTGYRRIERDVSNLQSLEEFLSSSFVIDRDVVGRVELTLSIVVDIDMHAIRNDTAGSRVELKIK